jgi:hypothetical protein
MKILTTSFMSNVSQVKQAVQTVLERLQAILQGCRLRMNPRKSHPHIYPQLLAFDSPKEASLDAYGGIYRAPVKIGSRPGQILWLCEKGATRYLTNRNGSTLC